MKRDSRLAAGREIYDVYGLHVRVSLHTARIIRRFRVAVGRKFRNKPSTYAF
jgi:hypothetical protein